MTSVVLGLHNRPCSLSFSTPAPNPASASYAGFFASGWRIPHDTIWQRRARRRQPKAYMPDFLILKGYSGPSLAQAQAQTKDVPIMVTNGVLGVARPTLTGTDRSIVAGVAATQLMAANTARMGFYLKNDTAIDVWFNIGAAAQAQAGGGNIKLPANGGYFESGTFTPGEAISIIAASGTPAITAREY